MGIIETLEKWDKQLFLFLNGSHNAVFDFIMPWISNKYVWIPLYALLLYWLIKTDRSKTIYTLVALCLLIFISDQVASGFLKPAVERFRPCYDLEIKDQVHLLKGCGGKFGFASSHASNSFAIAVFCWIMLRKNHKHIWLLLPWAAIIAYSRIYLGVHFPGDVIVGALIGLGAAYIVKYLFDKTSIIQVGT